RSGRAPPGNTNGATASSWSSRPSRGPAAIDSANGGLYALLNTMRRIRSLVRLVAFLALGAAPALAQSTGPEDLRALPAARQVTAVAYCAGLYRGRLADGVEREFKEYDLSFKTDT